MLSATTDSAPGQFFRDRRPIRGELLGPDGLAARAQTIAAASVKVVYGGGRKLLDMCATDAKSLRSTRKMLTTKLAAGKPPTGAAEWLYDNFHIVEEALREIEVDLPPGYYIRLPQLTEGTLRGLPRVYWLAAELIAHTDSAIDEATLRSYVGAYQQTVPLTIGELWAVPIMLRLVLLENLARLGEGIGTPVDGLLKSINQVSVSNAVTSLRLMSSIDWPVFYEATSVVHARLCADPAGVYQLQDFATRDRYRQRVELFARDSGKDELAVCDALSRRAAAHAPTAGTLPADVAPQSHVGYYLFGDGRKVFAKELGYKPGWPEWRLDLVLDRPRRLYFGAIAFVATIVLAAAFGHLIGTAAWWLAIVLTLPIAVELAIGLVHNLVTRFVPPRILPKLDFSDSIPSDCATFVVIPTLLTSAENNADLVERIEIHALSNPDANLFFALLTDWTDSPTETRATDAAQVEAVMAGIRELNRRHAPKGPPKFFLFHRRRLWNPVQNCWMGWERKRGKLSEFNRLLLGASDTTYSHMSCERRDVPKVRFIITLDSDTQLPREAAQRLIGTLAHPLNRPQYDAAQRRVVSGYSVLQPRVSVSMPAARRSRFAKLLSGSTGIDPYTTATSDVYQDLFGLGTFTGKGIYDLHAFEAATGATFPENHILSHDLIEGNFSRCGLVTDIEFVDDLPSRYNAYAKREHRWVRGDWQLLPWLGRRVPVPPGGTHGPAGGSGREREWKPNVLPLVERWKVFDNLRRSLTAPAVVLLLVLGWTVLPGSPWLWTLLALAVLLFPTVMAVPGLVRMAVRPSFWVTLSGDALVGMTATLGQGLLQTSFLLHQAWFMVDAVARTLYRMFVSGKKLLEWETAAATERRLGNSLADFFRFMAVAPVTAVVLAVAVSLVRPAALPAALPVLLLWLLSPALAYWVSKPTVVVEKPLTAAERLEMRRIARKTWAFFETFVTPDDHMLPPDNYQEHPRGVLARRTSPTNIGLSLLASLAARDFGYIGVPRLLERTAQTLAALDQLERHHGHFLNWYRTDTLAAMEPKYLSTVDSGNLLACLITLQHGLTELLAAPLAGLEWRAGLADTLALIATTSDGDREPSPTLRGQIATISSLLADQPSDDWADRLVAAAAAIDIDALPDGTQLERWVDALVAQVRELRDEAAYDAARVGDVPEFAATIDRLNALAAKFVAEMDFRPLYNDSRHLFAIGFNLSIERYDPFHYDLMASEACLTSFLTIARGEAHRQHWFQIGRPVARVGHSIALISWGGTMFEYLLPRVFFHTYPQTLLHETRDSVVAAQIAYGRKHRVPWGISESGYYQTDSDLNYLYMSFGVPGLGLKRGLEKDLVISPYSTLLAVMVRPREAVANFAALAAAGGEGPFGFYEAIDYTPARVPAGARNAVVRSYMAHHQAMGFLALANCLLDDPFPRRFHAEPSVRATELLLQERVPWDAPIQDVREKVGNPAAAVGPSDEKPVVRRVTTADATRLRMQLLSNGDYTAYVTSAGTDWNRYRGRDITRLARDAGHFVYLRDLTTGELWSAGQRPVKKPADEYDALFAIDNVTLRRRDGRIETSLEITVSPESSAQVRRVTVTNHDDRSHDVELTSFVEIAHDRPMETHHLPASGALVARIDETTWAVHAVVGEGSFAGEPEFETDATAFLGGQSLERPAALGTRSRLGGHTGMMGEPAFALRRRVHVASGSAVSAAFVTAVAKSRAEAEAVVDRFRHPHAVARTFELAWAHARDELRRSGIPANRSHLFQRLAAIRCLDQDGIPHTNTPTLRIVLDGQHPSELLAQLLLAGAFWRRCGLPVKMAVVTKNLERAATLIRESPLADLLGGPEGIAVIDIRDSARIEPGPSCVVLSESAGSLDDQVERLEASVDQARATR